MPHLFPVAPYEPADDIDLYKVDPRVVAELIQAHMNDGVDDAAIRKTVVAIVIRDGAFVVATIPQGKMQ